MPSQKTNRGSGFGSRVSDAIRSRPALFPETRNPKPETRRGFSIVEMLVAAARRRALDRDTPGPRLPARLQACRPSRRLRIAIVSRIVVQRRSR